MFLFTVDLIHCKDLLGLETDGKQHKARETYTTAQIRSLIQYSDLEGEDDHPYYDAITSYLKNFSNQNINTASNQHTWQSDKVNKLSTFMSTKSTAKCTVSLEDINNRSNIFKSFKT